jgi:hypothetical protein
MAVTEKVIDLRGPLGRVTVLIFHGRNSIDPAGKIHTEIRARYPSHERLRVVRVVDLRDVPAALRGIGRREIRKAYDAAAQRLAADAAVPELVLIFADWDGVVCDAFGVDGVDAQPAAVVIDAAGDVRAHHDQDSEAVLGSLEALLGAA